MTLVLDAGALIALDRNERAAWTRLKAALVRGEVPTTHAGVVAQVWRDGSRQARLASALASVEVRPIDDPLARAVGELLRRTRTADVIDAALAAVTSDGDSVITSDPEDLRKLLAAAGRSVRVLSP